MNGIAYACVKIHAANMKCQAIMMESEFIDGIDYFG